MTNVIVLDLNDLCRLISGGEVTCKTKAGNVAMTTEPDIAQKVHLIFRSIGHMDGGHQVSVDGREYIDRIVFQTHLEEQVIKIMLEGTDEDKV